MLELLKKDIKPRDIMTRKAFENAIVLTMALGGSTNAVLHLIAMAKSVQWQHGAKEGRAWHGIVPSVGTALCA